MSEAAAVARVLVAARQRQASAAWPLIAIDGPSGAGKSTLADAIARSWRAGASPRLVRLDAIYPGWRGLATASGSLERTLLAPLARGVPGGWRGWDWARNRPAASVTVLPGRPLIVEGCGAFEATAGRTGVVRVWVRAAQATRKRRALERDAGGFDPFWDLWETEWRRYVYRTDPLGSADLVVELPECGARGLR
ncbi:ATP-binding protein [Agromyces sp. NPDC055658]